MAGYTGVAARPPDPCAETVAVIFASVVGAGPLMVAWTALVGAGVSVVMLVGVALVFRLIANLTAIARHSRNRAIMAPYCQSDDRI
jgi:hypothetical protein